MVTYRLCVVSFLLSASFLLVFDFFSFAFLRYDNDVRDDNVVFVAVVFFETKQNKTNNKSMACFSAIK